MDNNNYLLISVGTSSATFDDMVLTVHINGEAKYLSVLNAEDVRKFIDTLNSLVGIDSPDMLSIPLLPVKTPMKWNALMGFTVKLEIVSVGDGST